MKLRKIDPNKIMIPEVRVTAQFDDELLEMFKSSIKEVGQLAPIICCEVDAQIVLVDGLHRLQEAAANKAETIDVVIMPGDMTDVLTRNIFLDHLRGKTPPSEMVKVIEVLWKEYGMDSEKIAVKTGLTRDYVEKLQLISEITPMGRKCLDEGLIGVGHAAVLAKIKDPERQEIVLNQLLIYRWKVREFEMHVKNVLELVEQREQTPAATPDRPPVKIKCRYCGTEHEPIEMTAPIPCPSCTGILFAALTELRKLDQAAQIPDK